MSKNKSLNLAMVKKSSLSCTRSQTKSKAFSGDENLELMVESMGDCTKVIADQHLLIRKTCEIISKDEAQECLLEDASTVINLESTKGSSIDRNDLKHAARCLEQVLEFQSCVG